jgi:hypothetical protein
LLVDETLYHSFGEAEMDRPLQLEAYRLAGDVLRQVANERAKESDKQTLSTAVAAEDETVLAECERQPGRFRRREEAYRGLTESDLDEVKELALVYLLNYYAGRRGKEIARLLDKPAPWAEERIRSAKALVEA